MVAANKLTIFKRTLITTPRIGNSSSTSLKVFLNLSKEKGSKSTTHSAWKGRSIYSGVYVEEKTFQYLYSEGDMVVLTDPETFEQLEVPRELFGKSAVYLKDDMTVRVQYYDGRPMSTTVPYRVTCTVVEAQAPMKGLSVNPQYKKVLLDNGLTILAPPFIVTGDAIVVNTADDSYLTRAK